jgi:hypothetical protein
METRDKTVSRPILDWAGARLGSLRARFRRPLSGESAGAKKQHKALKRVEGKVDSLQAQLSTQLAQLAETLQQQAKEQRKALKRIESLTASVKKVIDGSELANRDAVGVYRFGDDTYWFYDTVSSVRTGKVVEEIIGSNFNGDGSRPG